MDALVTAICLIALPFVVIGVPALVTKLDDLEDRRTRRVTRRTYPRIDSASWED